MSYKKKGKRRVFVCSKCGKEYQADVKPTTCNKCGEKNAYV